MDTDIVAKPTTSTPDCPDNVAKWAERYRTNNPNINLAVSMDPRIYNILASMADRDECDMDGLINEALIVWVKWLCKATREEMRENGDMGAGFRKTEKWYEGVKEYVEARDIHRAISAENWMKGNKIRDERIAKGMKSRRSWEKMFPGRPYPVNKLITPSV